MVSKKRMLFSALLAISLAAGVSLVWPQAAKAERANGFSGMARPNMQPDGGLMNRRPPVFGFIPGDAWFLGQPQQNQTRPTNLSQRLMGLPANCQSTTPEIPLSIPARNISRQGIGQRPQMPAVAPSQLTGRQDNFQRDLGQSQDLEIGQIVNAINSQRQANGLSPVSVNPILNLAALAKAQDMRNRNYFAHVAPDGKSDFDFIKEAGYRYQAAGSNIAEGNFGGSQGVVNAWMDSSGHRANILADFGQDIGIGIAGQYYVMFIAKPLQ